MSRESFLNTSPENCSTLYYFISFHYEKPIFCFLCCCFLRGIKSSHLFQQLCPRTPSCLAVGAQPRDMGSLPRLRDTTNTLLCAGSASSEAELMSQDTHPKDADMAGYTDCQNKVHRTHIKCRQPRPPPPLQLVEIEAP